MTSSFDKADAGLRAMGVVETYINIIFAALVILICVIVIVVTFVYRSNWKTTTGTVKDASCDHSFERRNCTGGKYSQQCTTMSMKKCSFEVDFKVDDETYKAHLSKDVEVGKEVKADQSISVSYDPKNPENAALHAFESRGKVRLVAIIILVIAVIGLAINIYLKENEMYQRLQGVSLIGSFWGD